MKLNYNKKSNDPIYYIQKGYRNGKKVTTKNIARIGKHSELLKITDDPLSYAKEQVRKYNEEEKNNNSVSMEIKIDFNEKIKALSSPASSSTVLNIGYFFLQQIYHNLDIGTFFKEITKDSKITFDPNEVNRFLTYARILDPDSKLGTFEHLDMFYGQPDFGYVHILRTMDIMYEHYNDYLKFLFEHSNNIVRRNTSVCYYDCTNYYFETESADDDYTDAVTGETVKGLRKYGVSKEHRPNPLVEMGLFMDRDGIPLSMCIVPGSSNEQTTAIPMEKELLEMFRKKKFIYCADAGLGSFNIRKFNSMGGRAFIVTQSVKKLSERMKTAVFNDFDYRLLSSNAPVSLQRMKDFDRTNPENLSLYQDRVYKVINADCVSDFGIDELKGLQGRENEKAKSKETLRQKLIITFSRKMMEYQRAVRNAQIERAKKLLENINPENYKKGPNDVTRFIRRKKAENSEENCADIYELNQDAIEEEEKYDGFYAVATNLDDDAKDILEISSKRYKIEDCFRIMKTNLSARPVYHQKRERIIAHFMICYTALLIYRLLENRLDRYGVHCTADNIIETLRNMGVAKSNDVFYMATYTGSEALTALNAVYDLGLDKKYYLPKELNKKLKKILK